MRIKVLGCSGGIGSGHHTSCYLINRQLLIDAGTGLGNLSLADMLLIEDVFITHPHMDHIACLPSFIDSTLSARKQPLNIWGSAFTIQALQQHIFNQVISPDFSRIPSADNPFIRYHIIDAQETVQCHSVAVTPFAVDHTVPTYAYLLTQQQKSYMICGDTGYQEDFWPLVNAIPNLKGLAIETAFCNEEATVAKHLSPHMLAYELAKLTQDIPIHIMHLMPSSATQILEELRALTGTHTLDVMYENQVIEI